MSALSDKLFVVLVSDRHADPDVKVFKRLDQAIEQAVDAIPQSAYRYEEDFETELNEYMIKDGWLYYCRYSPEGDSVRVMARDLQ